MGFGALRVLNDDLVAPSSGFDMHPHRDMEIITLVTTGTLTHKDSMGNTGTVSAGSVQAMSAGTGVTHAEYNDSPDTPLTLFQIWIEPNKRGVEPQYAQKDIGLLAPGLTLLVGPEGTEGLPIHQDAYLSRLVLDGEHSYTYTLHTPGNGLYAFVIEGILSVAGEKLRERDAIGLWDMNAVEFSSHAATILLIEVPMT